MVETRIQQIQKDIEHYQQAIENAEGALAEAERELVEELDKRYADDESRIEDYPEYDK